jgi:predicted anti-sigma-YlaC factor YlaD
MKCKEIHQGINSYLDKKLEADSLDLFNSHLKACSSCKRLVDEVSATWSGIDQVEKLQSDPFLYTRIMQEVENRTLTGVSRAIQRILQPMVAAAILVIGIYIGVGLGNNYSMDSEVFASAESQTLMDDYLFNDIEYESVEIFLLNE